MREIIGNLKEADIMKRVMIDGNNVHLLDFHKNSTSLDSSLGILKSLPTKEYLERLKNLMELEDLPKMRRDVLYPDGLKFFKENNSYYNLVIENPPQRRNINIEYDLNTIYYRLISENKKNEYGLENFLNRPNDPYRLNLMFPYIIYIITLTKKLEYVGLQVYYRPAPIKNISDPLFIANLPNLNDNNLCIGSLGKEYATKLNSGNLKEICDIIIDKFWFNTFNTDYIHQYTRYKTNPYVGDFLTWEYWSKKNPSFIFQVKWDVAYRSLEENICQRLDNLNKDEPSKRNYINLMKAFNSVETEIKKNNIIYYSYDTDFIITSDYFLYINSILELDQKEFIVSRFLKDRNRNVYIVLKDKDGNYLDPISRTDDRIVDAIEQQQNKNKIEKVVIDNKEISIGDFIVLNITNTDTIYQKVNRIEKLIDNSIVVQLSGGRRLISGISRFDIIDMNQPIIINGIKFEVGKNYLIASKSDSLSTAHPWCLKFTNYKYLGLDQYHDSLELNTDRGSLTVENIRTSYIVKEEKNVLKTDFFRFLTTIFTCDTPVGYIKNEGFMVSTYKREYVKDFFINKIKNQIKNNELFIPSYDVDINFKIGDLVAVANWSDINYMSSPKVLKGFKLTNNKLIFVLGEINDIKKESEVPYIDLINGKIDVGLIRHISLQIGDFKSNDRIRVKERCKDFSKRDVKKILYFITDGVKHPLVVFNDLTSQWLNQEFIDNFYITPDISKTLTSSIEKHSEFLPGDLVQINNSSEIGIYYSDKKICKSFNNLSSMIDYMFDSSNIILTKDESKINLTNYIPTLMLKRYGFMYPRKTKKELPDRLNSAPTLFGNYNKNITSYDIFDTLTRFFINNNDVLVG